MKETEQWAIGMKGEQIVRDWLKDQGFLVVPTSLIENGGAPALEGFLQRHVLPDNLAFKDGQGRWVEVKTKSKPTLHRNTNTWEHGLAFRLWCAYREVEEKTKLPGWLAVVEIESGYLLLAPMAQLAERGRIYMGKGMPDGLPHIFFPRLAFDWYEDGRVLKINGLAPQAPRTIEQPQAPTTRQLELWSD